MKHQIKAKTVEAVHSGKRIAANAEDFVQAASLLAVAAFSYYALGKLNVPSVERYGVYIALVVIGLRGAVELIRFLNHETH